MGKKEAKLIISAKRRGVDERIWMNADGPLTIIIAHGKVRFFGPGIEDYPLSDIETLSISLPETT